MRDTKTGQRLLRGQLLLRGAGFDIVDSEGGRWEVRSISRGGIYFSPSYMVGSGRRFNKAGFLSKLSEIKGYIVADIESFPQIPFWIISSEQVLTWWKEGKLGTITQISRKNALALLGESTTRRKRLFEP